MLFELEGRVSYNELERTLELGKLVTLVEGLLSQQEFPPMESLELKKFIEILHVAVRIIRRQG